MRQIVRWGVPGILFFIIMTTVWAIPAQQQGSPQNLFQQRLDNLRQDMELLADFVFGGGQRPDNWIGNLDFTSDSMLADLWLDNERLRDEVFGENIIPLDWAGATSRNAEIVARNIRHDLEVVANRFLGEGLRPDEWNGGPRLTECNRTIMNTILVLQDYFSVRENTPETVRVYCETLQGEIEDVLVSKALEADITEAEDNVPAEILAVRGDLERLADEMLGINNRPPGWIDNTDTESVSLASDLLVDLERLAEIVMNGDVRPQGWIGATRGSQLGTFRNLRHDLELLADIALSNTRPNGWQGVDKLLRCDPSLQTLVFLAERAYAYNQPEAEATGKEYCDLVRASANSIIENPPRPEGPDGEITEIDLQFTAESNWAFAYLDPAATLYMGNMPGGTKFRAWYRNFGGSTMMFVSGENFAVYIDRRWTTLDQDIFVRLPSLEGVRPLTFCDALWCNGPGPTPTPTGSGPLLDIINANTPPAPAPPAGTPSDLTSKELVSWNNLRVNYLLQRQDIGRVQVTLEICRDASQVACEPVSSVLDKATGLVVSAVSQFNGLNVYELPYGYSTNYTIEGQLYYAEDIWLNDPTLTGQ